MYRSHLASLISTEGMVDRKTTVIFLQFIKSYNIKPTVGIDDFYFLNKSTKLHRSNIKTQNAKFPHYG